MAVLLINFVPGVSLAVESVTEGLPHGCRILGVAFHLSLGDAFLLSRACPEQAASLCMGDGHCRLQTELA